MLKVLLIAATLGSCNLPGDSATAQGRRTGSSSRRPAANQVAVLGMTTTAPSIKQAKARGLKIQVRICGQVVTEVNQRGPAAKAGIGVGDILVQLDDNEIYSQDDIADYLAVSQPRQKVRLLVVRAKTDKRKTLNLVLGSKRAKAAKKGQLEWQFASLGQLDEALARAKKENRLVLVGLSGAET